MQKLFQQMVPQWFRNPGANQGSRILKAENRSWLEPFPFFLLYLCYGLFFLPVLTDWGGYAYVEGLFSYDTQRMLAGERPYADFSFPWTPGLLYLHVAAEKIWGSWIFLRLLALLASAVTAAMSMRLAQIWSFTRGQRQMLGLLLLLWGFNLWNIPDPVRYGMLAIICSALVTTERNRGVLWGLGFWFQQYTALAAVTGSIFEVFLKKRPEAFFYFMATVLFPMLAVFAFSRQIFWAATQILSIRQLEIDSFHWETLAPAMVFLGLWTLSLYFLAAEGVKEKLIRIVQLMILTYLAWSIYGRGADFFLGGFYFFTFIAWAGALVFIVADRCHVPKNSISLWALGLGAFLPIFCQLSFKYFLFLFPLSAFFLIFCCGRIAVRYPRIPRSWTYLPIAMLVMGGIFFQTRAVHLRLNGQRDAAGMLSLGQAAQLSNELEATIHFIKDIGAKPGEVVGVDSPLPIFYARSGFRESAKASENAQNAVLAKSKFFVSRPGATAPGEFVLLKKFPLYFSVWGRKGESHE